MSLKETVYGRRTPDGRRTKTDHNTSSWAFGSCELKTVANGYDKIAEYLYYSLILTIVLDAQNMRWPRKFYQRVPNKFDFFFFFDEG